MKILFYFEILFFDSQSRHNCRSSCRDNACFIHRQVYIEENIRYRHDTLVGGYSLFFLVLAFFSGNEKNFVGSGVKIRAGRVTGNQQLFFLGLMMMMMVMTMIMTTTMLTMMLMTIKTTMIKHVMAGPG
jgi:hypothetical protein